MFLFQFSAVSSGGTLVEIEMNVKGNIFVNLNGTRKNVVLNFTIFRKE